MAGPNLEIFKFGIYLFFPLAVMVHYGDPVWYRKHVLPIRDEFWPRESALFTPPRTTDTLKSTLEKMKEQRLARREARLRAEAGLPAIQPSTAGSKTTKKGLGQLQRNSQQPGATDLERIDRQRLV